MMARVMARPKDADSAKTYDAIVAAARTLLFTESDESTAEMPMRRIAALAGVSYGTLSYYFPTKEDLLERCLDAHYERLSALVQDLFTRANGAARDPVGFVEHAARQFYRFALEDRAEMLLRNATNAKRGTSEYGRVDLLGHYLDGGATVLALLTESSEAQARLAIHSVMTLIVRYVTLSDADLVAILGAASESARGKLEDHVVEAAVSLAFPG